MLIMFIMLIKFNLYITFSSVYHVYICRPGTMSLPRRQWSCRKRVCLTMPWPSGKAHPIPQLDRTCTWAATRHILEASRYTIVYFNILLKIPLFMILDLLCLVVVGGTLHMLNTTRGYNLEETRREDNYGSFCWWLFYHFQSNRLTNITHTHTQTHTLIHTH